jgi:hypothetical protein
MIATLIAVMMAMGMFSGTVVRAAEDKSTVQNDGKSKVTKKEAKSFAKKVVQANSIDKILKTHSSCSISGPGFNLWFDKEKAFYDAYEIEYSCYADDDLICTLKGDDPSSFKYVVDTNARGDKYVCTTTHYHVDDTVKIENILEDKHISLVDDGRTITYIGKLSESNIPIFKEIYGVTADIKEAYSRLVVKSGTYEILEWDTYSKGNEEHPEMMARYTYDTEESTGCCLMRRMAHRQEKKTVKVTVIRDKGTEKEYRKKMTIPQNSLLTVSANGVDGLYTDADYTKPLGDWNGKSNITIYCRTVESSDGETTASETDNTSKVLNEKY